MVTGQSMPIRSVGGVSDDEAVPDTDPSDVGFLFFHTVHIAGIVSRMQAL